MNLNPQQQAAVEETDKPVLVLAGPGTGKTAMMVQKYKHLVVEAGLDPERILITTFTRKATEELEERISTALHEHGHYSKVEVQNFHSFCLQLLKDHPDESGFSGDPPILDGLQLRRFFLENRERFVWEHVPFVRWVHTPMERLQSFMSGCISAGVSPSQAKVLAQGAVDRADAKDLRKRREFLDYAENYDRALQLLREKGIMTYDLMLFDAVRLLESHDDVRMGIEAAFDYVLVDEVQDNNGLQARLVELIVGNRGCVTVVGDEDQGIYKFRGAERGILERFEERFKPERIDLFQNYRSSHHIVAASMALIANNDDRFEGKKLVASGMNKDFELQPQVRAFRNEEQEILHLAAQIESCIAKGRSPGDIAVLFRSLNHKGRLLEELSARGIPYEITNVAELLRLGEVRDLWAWMSTLSNPAADNPAFERVLQSNEVGLPLTELALVQQRFYRIHQDIRHQKQLLEDASEEEAAAIRERLTALYGDAGSSHNLVQILRNLDGPFIDDAARQRLRWLRSTLESLSQKVRGQGALDAAYTILGWLKPQRRHHPDDARSKQMWANLADFLQVIKDYEETYPDDGGVQGFLGYLDYLDRQGASFQERSPDETEDSVKLITAHRAKGLQWPVVFIPACNKGRFPSRNRGDWLGPLLRPDVDTGKDHEQEERRVFFVAMTRAEQELHCSYSLHVSEKEVARSVFLDEVLDAGLAELLEVSEDLQPSEGEDTAFEDEQYARLHGALRSVSGMSAQELQDRMKRAIQASGEIMALEAGVEAVEAALAEYGFESQRDRVEEILVPKRLVLSASALNTYADCPRKFQFQYILRIPQKISGSAVAGSNVHRALEVFHKRHRDDWREQDVSVLLGIYDEVFAKARFESPDDAKKWRERDVKILEAYLTEERDVPGEPTHFEVPFRLQFEDLDAEFYGYIDRVDEHPDGTVEIIDYKTGARKTANKIVGEDFQVPLYVAAFEDKGRDVKAGTLYWMRDAGDGTGPVERMRMERKTTGKPKGEFTDDAMQAFRERVVAAVEGIRAGEFTEDFEKFKCGLCDYRGICPGVGG